MTGCRISMTWLALVVGAAWATAGVASVRGSPIEGAVRVPYDQIPASVRERVRLVVEHAKLATRGPTEAFACLPAQYYWLLAHPDRAATVWRYMGAKSLDIADRGNGRFGWTDKMGSDVHWDTVYANPHMRIWYAEGLVRAGPLLPLAPLQAVVILRFNEERDEDGRPLIRHQADLLLYSDSKTVALITRLVGASAPRMAEQYIAQVELFFSAMSWFLDKHPDWARAIHCGELPAGGIQQVDYQR
jgi:hypothetical protein